MEIETAILTGVRVIDLSMFLNGPAAASMLAYLGAEVIKVESLRHPDPDRIAPLSGCYINNEPGKDPWNRVMEFHQRQRNKLALTLDLTTAEGKELFQKLVRISDVVVENFRAGVMERLGIDYPVLKDVNPRIILLSATGHGRNSPEQDYGCNAFISMMLSGIRSLTDYRDSVTNYADTSLSDTVNGVTAAGGVLAALLRRRKTGLGMHVEVSQRELMISYVGEAILDFTMNGRVAKPIGNRHAFMAPHGCYRCSGDDMWVTIAVASDEEWQRLCQAIGKPELANDARFGDSLSRYQNQSQLDSIIETWTSQMDHHTAMQLLQKEGVPASAVLTAREMVSDPHLKQRKFFEESPDQQFHPYPYKGLGIRFSKTPGRSYRRAPNFGEHNRYILHDLLGLSDKEIAELESKSIVGSRPDEEFCARAIAESQAKFPSA